MFQHRLYYISYNLASLGSDWAWKSTKDRLNFQLCFQIHFEYINTSSITGRQSSNQLHSEAGSKLIFKWKPSTPHIVKARYQFYILLKCTKNHSWKYFWKEEKEWLPEAQRTQPIELVAWFIFLTKINLTTRWCHF